MARQRELAGQYPSLPVFSGSFLNFLAPAGSASNLWKREKGQMSKTRDLIKPYRIADGRNFRLEDFKPDETDGFQSKDKAQHLLERGVKRLSELQEKLYAQDQWAVLLIFQAMDAAGKDGTISHVMSGVNPQGCQVYSFKAPSTEELDHDFLWRTNRCIPERGRIGIFNRSYYEEVLIVRVHPEFLHRQRVPPHLFTKDIWKHRFEDINAFERYLTRNGVAILKFFLNVSKEEQRKRFLARLDDPAKQWKFSSADIEERNFWKDYQHAYGDMIRNTSSKHAPWHVVPADHKWYTRLVVSETIIEKLESLDLKFPAVNAARKKELATIRKSFAR